VVPAGERDGTTASHGPEDDERNNQGKALRTPPIRMNGCRVAVFCSDVPIFSNYNMSKQKSSNKS
jgi:hypothetical protein